MPTSAFFARTPRVPKYRRHKPTDQAVVTLNGKDHYLGRWNSKTSRAAYERIVGEWLASDRTLRANDGELSVAELCRAYLTFAKGYYRKDGKVTGTNRACRLLAVRSGPKRFGESKPSPTIAMVRLWPRFKGQSSGPRSGDCQLNRESRLNRTKVGLRGRG
jgi:hypothetical protein